MDKKLLSILAACFLVVFIDMVNAHGLEISNVSLTKDCIKRKVEIHYNLKIDGPALIDDNHPIYVFISYNAGLNNSKWNRPLGANVDLNGNGIRGERRDGIINMAGEQVIYFYWEGEKFKDTEILKDRIKFNIHAVEMVLVPAGQYTLGNDNATYEVDGAVNLNAFYALKYPVTIKQYAQYLNETGQQETDRRKGYFKYSPEMNSPACGIMRKAHRGNYSYTVKAGRENCPIVYVTWFNAYDYAKWAGLRLITDEEWEVLARGKDGRRYSWGNLPEPNGIICNMFNDGLDYASDVYKYAEIWNKMELDTPFGARELTGNVWEWVDTYWYDYSEGIYDTTKSHTSYTSLSNRVIRGGDWGTAIKWQRAAARDNDITPFSRNYGIGFRCGADY